MRVAPNRALASARERHPVKALKRTEHESTQLRSCALALLPHPTLLGRHCKHPACPRAPPAKLYRRPLRSTRAGAAHAALPPGSLHAGCACWCAPDGFAGRQRRGVVQTAVATSQFCVWAATRALRWSRERVRPHKMSGRCLACFRVRQMWVSARSDAACVCMCARGSGNALFEHVFRSCG